MTPARQIILPPENHMPMHPNFAVRSNNDAEAMLAAALAILRVMMEKSEVDLDRVHQLVATATGDDVQLRARARWFVDWCASKYDTEGERP